MGSANLVPIGNANLRVQDKPRGFRFSDDRACHHGIRLAIPFLVFGLCGSLAVISIFGEDRPDDPCGFVCHRDRGQSDGFAFKELHDPGMHAFWIAAGALHL